MEKGTVIPLVLQLMAIFLCTGAQENAKTISEFYATFYDEIAKSAIEGNLIDANVVEKYIPHLEQQLEAAVHMTAKTPDYLIEESNFLIDTANALNVDTFDDMEFSAYPALDYAIKTREDAVCYPIKCDPNAKWRRTDGRCNNLNNPRWGAANVAQNRVIPAEWEKGAILPFTLYPKTVIDATRNGVKVNGVDNVILQAQGNIPLLLRFEGEATLEIVLQPAGSSSSQEQVEAVSTVAIDGEVLDKSDEPFFDVEAKSPIWVEFTETKDDLIIRIGRGSECDEENSIFEILYEHGRFERLIIEGGKENEEAPDSLRQFVETSFYIRSTYEIVTSDNSEISLQNVPWVYSAHKSIVFGVEEKDNFKLALIAEGPEAKTETRVELDMGLEEGHFSLLNICDGECSEYPFKHENIFSQRARVQYIWVSWMGRSINCGRGQIVGKNQFNIYEEAGVRRLLSADLAVRDVRVSSKAYIKWIFNIEQINKPRKTSISGAPLRSARDISLAVHCRIGSTKWSKHLSLMTFQTGQHVDHDVIGTPVETYEGHSITCVENNVPLPLEEQSRHCFNIPVTDFTNAAGDQGEHPFATVKALNFVRSGVVIDCDHSLLRRDLRVRNPMNLLTSFVDAGNLYSNSDAELNELRVKLGGDTTTHTSQYMIVDEANELPPTSEMGEAACNNDDPAELCRKSGDFRNNENSGLNSLHTLWAREHNRIARELTNNQGFPSSTASEREIIFQHTRRIVIAEMQNIVYQGYLKSFMDADIGDKYGLGIGDSRRHCNYQPYLDPTMLVCFGIAYRMGHTWITEILREDDDPVVGLSKIELLHNFFDPHPSYESNGTNSILKYLAGHACPDTDSTLERTVTEDLFRMGNVASDLAALNIQRGRDHGCANYCTFRKHYDLYVPKSWNDVVKKHIMTQETVDSLKLVYDCVCDLDLFTAVITETALIDRPDIKSTSLLGELLNHIMSDMFGRLRCGDRFWYEFDAAGLTEKQKEELSKSTLARILCDNVPIIDEIQKDVFKLPNLKNNKGKNINKVVNCDEIPRVNLSKFKYKGTIGPADETAQLEDMLELLRELENDERN